jgi:mannose-1-phosphate guanylyltransferase/mannose-6-phosphate isomerase
MQDGFEPPVVVCNNDHRFLAREQVERVGITPNAIILEPVARNTTAAIAVAALYLHARDPASIIGVLPSDHMIKDQLHFSSSVRLAGKLAARGKIVLFGVKPTEPHTGYGYIRRGSRLKGCHNTAFTASAFVEKPSRETAQQFLATGDYYWNSGVFVMSTNTLLDELESLEPATLKAAQAALANAKEDCGFIQLDRGALSVATNISIDRAVVEKTSHAVILPFDCGWSDVGSWSSLWDISPRDESENFVFGEAVLEDTSNCYVCSDKALVATLGVRDLVIVSTPDALLVANKNRAQEVSSIVKRLKQSNRKEHEQHLRNHRPWGHFECLSTGERFQVKLLHVNPGAKLSLQMHHHRSEHWTVVHGTARVVVGDTERLLCENESVYVSATQWHRLENPGKVPLEVIEVQIGTYLGEDDILRSDDVYRRAQEETR